MEKEKIGKRRFTETVGKGKDAVLGKAKETAIQVKKATADAQAKMVEVIDQDGNGQIDTTDIILIAMKVPGVKINRAEFLRKELFKNHTEEEIDKAIKTTPALAGIPSEEIDIITDEVIKAERYAVTGISAALGLPGGVAMAATIPADIGQYYGYMLRAAQKMLYLYGFPELDTSGDGLFLDSETINSLTLCLGVMYGVASAENAVKAMAKALATGVEK